MARFMVAAVCLVLFAPAVARGEEPEERLRSLERELEAMKEKYEKDVGGLRRRVEELETERGSGADAGSELERLVEEAAAAAEAAEEEAGGPAALLAPPAQTRLNAFNPRITVFGDFVFRLDDREVRADHDHGGHADEEGEEHEEEGGDEEEEAPRIDDRASLRSVEIDLRADIDPFAKAVAILGLHEHEPGEYEFHPEEVYVTLETLPFGLRAKVGRFLASMGVMNRLHPHDFPQTTAPLVLEEWLGHEGMAPDGAELSWLAPAGPVDSIELVFGLYSGELDYLAGSDSNDPAFLGRAQLFETLSDSTYVQLGTSHLFGFTDAEAEHPAWLGGLDVMFRWRPPARATETSLFAQAEAFLSDRETEEGRTRSLGGYALVTYQPMRDLYVGVRFDHLEPLDRFDGEGRTWAGGLWVSYYTSEFLRFRIGYEHRGIEREEDLDTLWFQMTFVFGSHPVEPYWFNK